MSLLLALESAQPDQPRGFISADGQSSGHVANIVGFAGYALLWGSVAVFAPVVDEPVPFKLVTAYSQYVEPPTPLISRTFIPPLLEVLHRPGIYTKGQDSNELLQPLVWRVQIQQFQEPPLRPTLFAKDQESGFQPAPEISVTLQVPADQDPLLRPILYARTEDSKYQPAPQIHFGAELPGVTPVPVVLQDSIGGKPEKKRKHKKSYYDNVDELVSALSKIEPQIEPQTDTQAVPPVIKEEHLVEKKAESQYITAMAEAFERAGKFPEKSVSSIEQEEIDRKRRINMAAIILLLD